MRLAECVRPLARLEPTEYDAVIGFPGSLSN
jgi:hypothetical protein